MSDVNRRLDQLTDTDTKSRIADNTIREARAVGEWITLQGEAVAVDHGHDLGPARTRLEEPRRANHVGISSRANAVTGRPSQLERRRGRVGDLPNTVGVRIRLVPSDQYLLIIREPMRCVRRDNDW